jgi:CubicO group peptidase (beta-lactamase class C family)
MIALTLTSSRPGREKIMKAKWIGALMLASLQVTGAAATELPDASAMDALMQRGFDAFGPTGMAVAYVRDGETVLAKGYGVLEAGKKKAVDEDTLFEVGSLTKAFTAAALAILVDEGRIGWDDPVIKHLPEFMMYDPWVTRAFTIRDALTHRSGLGQGAGDLLFWPDNKSSVEEIIKALRHLKPVSGFRSEFAYDNLMYVVAGHIVEVVSGQSWEEFVEARLLKPIGMKGCRATHERISGTRNIARPHARTGDKAAVIDFDPVSPVRMAGGIVCSANGMAEWAKLMLRGGKSASGDTIFASNTVRELWSPVTPVRIEGGERQFEGAHFKSYALGWTVQDYWGDYVVTHNGAVRGSLADISLLPDLKSAVIILSNDITPTVFALHQASLMALAGDNAHDMIAVIQEMVGGQGGPEQAPEEGTGEATEEAPAHTPELPLSAFAGTYQDPWYGAVTVAEEDTGLVLSFSRSKLLRGSLRYHGNGTFVVQWFDRSLNADAYITFAVDPDGSVTGATMKAVSPQTDFSYDFHDLDLKKKRAAE